MTIAIILTFNHWWWVRNELTNHTILHSTLHRHEYVPVVNTVREYWKAYSASSIPLLRVYFKYKYLQLWWYQCCVSHFIYVCKNIFGRCDFLNCFAKLTTAARITATTTTTRYFLSSLLLAFVILWCRLLVYYLSL